MSVTRRSKTSSTSTGASSTSTSNPDADQHSLLSSSRTTEMQRMQSALVTATSSMDAVFASSSLVESDHEDQAVAQSTRKEVATVEAVTIVEDVVVVKVDHKEELDTASLLKDFRQPDRGRI
ncbi:hypothetical protein L5515_005068 [Caenorhabditis briggsae]|uniref:Uncharacterized protein n=1 Tax=Caenorhabditis briggsae TaxID=6238 RepID=A0AAE9EP82_CAEBR|nr:hypothetical protein L5515_005068 [Caenorhabditis briggsae]